METYQELFDAYVAELREAMAAAKGWWDTLVAKENEDVVRRRWPFGPASHPFVIAVFRKWSLAVQDLNDEMEAREDVEEDEDEDEDEADWGESIDNDEAVVVEFAALEPPVQPRQLLLDMLPGRADDVATFMQDFVFDPVGLDKEDRWV